MIMVTESCSTGRTPQATDKGLVMAFCQPAAASLLKQQHFGPRDEPPFAYSLALHMRLVRRLTLHA